MKTSLAAMKESLKAADATATHRELFQRIEDVEAKYGSVALGILALDGKRDEAITKMNLECRPLLAALLKATIDYASRAAASCRSTRQ